MLPGARARDLFFPSSVSSGSFERLILAEVGDREPERIDGNQFIGDAALEDEHEVRGIEVALQFAVIGGRVVHHVEIDARAVRRILHLRRARLSLRRYRFPARS